MPSASSWPPATGCRCCPALWWSDINRNAAAALTVWYVLAQIGALWLLWRWLGNFRRLVVRYERHALNYLGFVLLGCILILLRQSC